jgi:hypothetical protein
MQDVNMKIIIFVLLSLVIGENLGKSWFPKQYLKIC